MSNPKFFIPVTLFSTILLYGCSQSPKQSNTETPTSVASAANATPTSVPSHPALSKTAIQMSAQGSAKNTVTDTQTAQALLTVLSGLMFKSLNENLNQHLTTEQKTCLLQANPLEQLPNFQRYLQAKLTVDELTKTNQYYALPVGQKQIQIAKQQLFTPKGETIHNPVTLTDDEKLQIQAFQGTPEGKKLAGLFSPTNQLELEQALGKPLTDKVLTACRIKQAELAVSQPNIPSASNNTP